MGKQDKPGGLPKFGSESVIVIKRQLVLGLSKYEKRDKESKKVAYQ